MWCKQDEWDRSSCGDACTVDQPPHTHSTGYAKHMLLGEYLHAYMKSLLQVLRLPPEHPSAGVGQYRIFTSKAQTRGVCVCVCVHAPGRELKCVPLLEGCLRNDEK